MRSFVLAMAVGCIFLQREIFAAERVPRLTLEPSLNSLQVSWPGTVRGADGSVVRPYFELQRSLDLRAWRAVGERQRAKSDETLRMNLSAENARGFYRLLSVVPPAQSALGTGGEEVFGYGEAFAQELQWIGQIAPEELAALYPGPEYLPGITWDPREAAYWEQFNADPEVVNRANGEGKNGYRTVDYRLNSAELSLFIKNGFVVSERLGGYSFGEVFYLLWQNDLPVFISSDALLQAWHRTYDAMLEEVDETYLYNGIETMLDAMAAQLPAAVAQVGNGPLKDSLRDADFFLAVARSLLAGRQIDSHQGQNALVAATLADVQTLQMKPVEDFMGFCRMVDYSQFKVRGHYEHSERLSRYFRCLMWLGRIDTPIAGGPFQRCPFVERFASPRELGLAVVLSELLKVSSQFNSWSNMEQVIQTFVGATDSLTFGSLNGLLAAAGIRSLADVPDLATLERLQADIARGELGIQNITSDFFQQPLDSTVRYVLPQTFTVFGQKFIPDSWAFSQTVFNNIQWVEKGETTFVQRRVPGALDVAFSVLANNQVVPEIIAQIDGSVTETTRPHAGVFRDGHPYQHNLAAVRAVMDSHNNRAWEKSIYMNWLASLRELSRPTTERPFPEAMRTHAWAMKTLNTQLASWTQLRHDTILYAKQSYTFGGGACFYPTGFVEPRTDFWRRFYEMAARTADLIQSLTYQGTYEVGPVPLADIQKKQVDHLRRFSEILAKLLAMSEKEVAQQCFTKEEELFIGDLMQQMSGGGCGVPMQYNGWYPSLFYRAIHWDETSFHQKYGAGAYDAVVTDVHTDVPCADCEPRDVGSVLHEGVGRVNLLMMAVDNGNDRFICAGPVLSHYEFEVTGSPRRLSDSEWQIVLEVGAVGDVQRSQIEGLEPPRWTQGYLAPR